ncbi:MAG: ArsR/SmtB family transcription factor [Candidatus Aquicultor sp.]
MSIDEICVETRFDASKVNDVKEHLRHLIPDVAIERLSDTFKVLSDPTRVKIVFALRRSELCVCEIAEVVGMSQSAVSHQLRKLKDHRVVKRRKAAKMVYYSLDDEHIIQLLTQGISHVQEELHNRMDLPIDKGFR